MRIKKGLKDLNPTNLSFPEGTKIYVNDSLCPYYRDYGMNARNFGIIRFILTLLLMVVRIKQVQNGPYKSITHINDLRVLFPGKQISMS